MPEQIDVARFALHALRRLDTAAKAASDAAAKLVRPRPASAPQRDRRKPPEIW